MSHLNYFEPYQSKTASHEDQLTRAFLVVLRHSQCALLLFYDIVRQACESVALEQKQTVILPHLSSLSWNNVEIETQKSSFVEFLSDKTLSVLLTDEKIKSMTDVKSVSRGARYDGIIKLGDMITLVIENKPRSYNVWQQQLNPNLEGHETETEIIKIASIVEWKTIIKSLASIAISPSVMGAERTLIADFINFIGKHFGHLNPYDTLDQCKENNELIRKRLSSLLRSIAKDPNAEIGYSWERCSLLTNLPSVKYAFIHVETSKEKESDVTFDYYFGDTTYQARNFYTALREFKSFEILQREGWLIEPNFHLSFVSTNLIWFRCPKDKIERYFEYCKDNINSFTRMGHDGIKQTLAKLEENNLIRIDNLLKAKLEKEIYQTKRELINVCPGFAIHYSIPFAKASDLDRKKLLAEEIKKLFKRPLVLLGMQATFLQD